MGSRCSARTAVGRRSAVGGPMGKARQRPARLATPAGTQPAMEGCAAASRTRVAGSLTALDAANLPTALPQPDAVETDRSPYGEASLRPGTWLRCPVPPYQPSP